MTDANIAQLAVLHAVFKAAPGYVIKHLGDEFKILVFASQDSEQEPVGMIEIADGQYAAFHFDNDEIGREIGKHLSGIFAKNLERLGAKIEHRYCNAGEQQQTNQMH